MGCVLFICGILRFINKVMNTGVKRIFGSLAVSSLILSCSGGEASPSLMQGGNNNAIVPYKGVQERAIVPYKGVQERADSGLGRVIEFREEKKNKPLRLYVMLQSTEQRKKYELAWEGCLPSGIGSCGHIYRRFVQKGGKLSFSHLKPAENVEDRLCECVEPILEDADIVKHLRDWDSLNRPVCETKGEYIVELLFNSDSIKDKGCKELAKLRLPNLQVLDVSGNHIGNEGLKHLSKALWVKLSTLDLSHNEITGILPIVYAKWPGIKCINLNNNHALLLTVKDLSKANFFYEHERPAIEITSRVSEETEQQHLYYAVSGSCHRNTQSIIDEARFRSIAMSRCSLI